MSEKSAVLVGIDLITDDYFFEDSIEELKDLCVSLGLEELYVITQKRESYDSKYLIGSGKVQEIKTFIDNNSIDLVVFNDELSGSQLNNLMETLDTKVVDRPSLILDIFANRAKTKLAKLQIELAQLKYRLPRLKGMGESLSRLGAGIGTRGPGEQKLEIDRRRISSRIHDIEQKIKKMEKVRQTQRKKRLQSNIPIVSLVGYSNVGKSTIFNKLAEKYSVTEGDVYVDDLLFATLDTHAKKITLDNNKEFILIDTIGFISKLPHFLIQAFKATLEEVKTSDLILNVVDFHTDKFDQEIKITEDVLEELDALEIPRVIVYNKIDQRDIPMERLESNEIKISALTGRNMEYLIDKIEAVVFADYQKIEILLPFSEGEWSSVLHDNYEITFKKYLKDGILISANVPKRVKEQLGKYIIAEDRYNELKA